MGVNHICGVYRLKEDTTFRYAGYECAAWWQEIKVPAGEYTVTAHFTPEGRLDEFFVGMQGEIVRDNFQSLYCGMPIGRAYDETQNAGRPAIYTIRVYYYDAFKVMHKDGDKSAWQIDVTKLPDVHPCAQCGTYTVGLRELCVTCAIAAEKVRLAEIHRRFPMLLKAVQTGGLRVARFCSIFDQMIDSYLEDRSNPQSCGYHRKQVTQAIKNVRALRHLVRLGNCQHGKAHTENCWDCKRYGFRPVEA